jgi:hypothetical protein
VARGNGSTPVPSLKNKLQRTGNEKKGPQRKYEANEYQTHDAKSYI